MANNETTLADRWLEGLRGLSCEQVAALDRSVRYALMGWEMWMHRREPQFVVPLSLRPMFVDPAALGHLHHAAWQLRRGIRKVGERVGEDGRLQEVLGVSEEEREWFESFGRPGMAGDTRFCRLDALFAPGGTGVGLERPPRLQFIEANVVGIGGMSYAGDAGVLLAERVMPWVVDGASSVGTSGEWIVEPTDDPRALLRREFDEFARFRRLQGPPRVVVLDEQEEYDSDGETRRVVEWMNQQGMEVSFRNPREFDSAICRETDIVYRMVDLPSLLAIQRQGADLSGLREAFEAGKVLPGILGDLDHKSVFEIFTDRRFREMFSTVQGRVFDRHVLWTRRMGQRETRDPAGNSIDLPAFVRAHRQDMVLKPNRNYGGVGVVIGRECSRSEWDEAIERALGGGEEYVVQEFAPLVSEAVPIGGRDGLQVTPAHTVIGLFPSRYGLGALGRYAGEAVVNISRGGGVVPVIIDYS